MKKILLPKIIFLFGILWINCTMQGHAFGQDSDNTINTPVVGPETGSLVVVGGAMRDTAITLKFLELAGGKDAPIVVIPTASGSDSIQEERVIRFLTRLGATNVTVVHTYDPGEANTKAFVHHLYQAQGVWFTGGRQWRIVDAYANTLTEKAIKSVLERGGVIGGSSAGATIQGSYLVRGDTKTNRIMMGDHEKGFGYLRNVAIDQHLLVRNRQFDLIEVIESHPELLGIGLDENTAIVVQGDTFEVLGESFVAIYDPHLWNRMTTLDEKPVLPNGGRFFLLRSGDQYDLKSRKVIHWTGNNRGISRDVDVR